MCNRKTLSLAVVLWLVSAASAFALDTGKTKIVRIAPWANGTEVQTEAGNSCNGTAQLVIGYGTSYMDRNYNLAVAAFLAGRQVNINYTCNGSTANVVSVRIY